jgi:glycosyltransferase involved in cell wall biosynthesis
MEPFLCMAIPTMKRWSFLKENLPLFLSRPEVKEVVITDETGEDAKAIQSSTFYNHPKLRVYTNESRLGIYLNKRKALSLAKAPWVALIDSDNSFPDSWFEILSEVILENNPKMMYGSALFRSVNLLTGEVIQHCKDFENLKLNKRNWNQIVYKIPKWNFLLNDGNWVVHSSAIQHLPEVVPKEFEAGARFCDAIYSLRCFVEAGYTIWYVPELSYIHTVHPESSWLTTERPSTQAFNTTNWSL